MPRWRRPNFGASPSRRPTGSLVRGAPRPIRRRFASRRRLNVRRDAIVAHLRRVDPIDRSPRLVGPINPDGVAALAQAGERGPRRVRQPAGGGDKFGECRAIAALQQFDDLRFFIGAGFLAMRHTLLSRRLSPCPFGGPSVTRSVDFSLPKPEEAMAVPVGPRHRLGDLG